ncbi:MAG: ArsR/SmtB family transcription factor [Acidimicrobiia bacterium]
MARTEPLDALDAAVEFLKALASTVRLAVIAELSVGPRCVHELQATLRSDAREISQPLLSQHLKVLRDAGLVTTTRRGAEITYQLADHQVGRLVHDAIRRSKVEPR